MIINNNRAFGAEMGKHLGCVWVPYPFWGLQLAGEGAVQGAAVPAVSTRRPSTAGEGCAGVQCCSPCYKAHFEPLWWTWVKGVCSIPALWAHFCNFH